MLMDLGFFFSFFSFSACQIKVWIVKTLSGDKVSKLDETQRFLPV